MMLILRICLLVVLRMKKLVNARIKITAKLAMENDMNRYSLLIVVENKQMSATSAVVAAPHPIMGKNAMMKISTQDTAIIKATLQGTARVGYKKGFFNAKYLSG